MDLLLVTNKSRQLWLSLLGLLYCFCGGTSELILTSSQPEGGFCEGPATFNCTVRDFNFDRPDDVVVFSIDGRPHYMCGRMSADNNIIICQPSTPQTLFTGSNFNTNTNSFSASVGNITAYNDSSAECTARNNAIRSDPIRISVVSVQPLSETTLPRFDCELSGSGSISLSRLSTFNMQHRVERYSVTAGPTSCISDQVSPSSEDFGCSVLTNFAITVTPENCGGQKGGSRTIPLILNSSLAPNPPRNVTLNSKIKQALWIESMEKTDVPAGDCIAPLIRATDYMLLLENDTSILEIYVSSAQNCNSTGKCHYDFPDDESQFCRVIIAAKNSFGMSKWMYSIAYLVQGDAVLLVFGIYIAMNLATY